MMSRLSLFFLLLFMLFPSSALADYWAKTYGGPDGELGESIQETSDGGFIVAGTKYFSDNTSDYWVLKLDAEGNLVWQKAYSVGGYGFANSIHETSDGGFVVAGGVYGGSGDLDICVLKLDAQGLVLWQKTYDGQEKDEAYSIQVTSDGGLVVAGYTRFYGTGNQDNWILKLDANGDVVWQKTYGGTDLDGAYSIQETSDGGFAVAGGTHSFGAVGMDLWVLKLDAQGLVDWQKKYGGAYWGSASSIHEASDGGFILAGNIAFKYEPGSYFWIVKLTASGDVVWQKAYDWGHDDYAHSIH